MKVLLVPALNASPLVLVAVSVTRVPAVGSVTAGTVIELVPAVIVPVIVPPREPPLPLVVNVNAVAATTFTAAP